MDDYTLNKNSYVNFDAINLKSLILDRLNEGGVFTDQNYQGSNLSALIDIISLVFGNLMFYLNKTSSESMFSESQLYENMNRIVKVLSYKPVGYTTSILPIRLAVSEIETGNYTIPRYSFINVGGTNYSFNNDLFISKTTNLSSENLTELNDKVFLYQGLYQEYPPYTAAGSNNETIYLSFDDNTFIDHHNIDVYVKPYNTNQWIKYGRVNELYLHTSNETVYEIRYNENKRYEIKFGDNINGKKLENGDQVLVYYLSINPSSEIIGANASNGSFIVPFNSLLYSSILDDTNSRNANYLNISQLRKCVISNYFPSTEHKLEETVEDIRQNAPKTFRAQYRLTTKTEYEAYVRSNYSNLVHDLKVLDNNDYLTQYLKYLYDIGLNNPQKEKNVLFNQIKFANACNFNNLYLVGIPKTVNQAFLTPPQKEIILNGLEQWKTVTTELVPMDPVYIVYDFYVPIVNEPLSRDNITDCKLVVYKKRNSTQSNSYITLKIKDIFSKMFSRNEVKLGHFVDINALTTNILAIQDIENIKTYNQRTDSYTDGIVLLGWNYYYPESDIKIYSQSTLLEDFKFPVFNSLNFLENKIVYAGSENGIAAEQF
jgi:hypothetical protein